MSTDVKTSMLPVPNTESNVPVKRAQEAVRPDRSDGRKFAEELSRGSQTPTQPVKPKQVNNEKIQDAADQVRQGVNRVADQLQKPLQGTDGQQVPTEQVIPEGTLDAKALKLAVRKQAGIARGTDAIEFLTGKLDRIDPSQISELVSDNEFITDALAAQDVDAFMRMPLPVEKLLEQLEIPEEIAATLQAAGIGLGDTISPKDFFRAIGVDPGRVYAEVDLLKQNLPIDGVVPYIQRAERMQGIRTGTAPATSSAKDATMKATSQQSAKRDAVQGAAASMAAATAKAAPGKSGANLPVGGATSAFQNPLGGVTNPISSQVSAVNQVPAPTSPEIPTELNTPKMMASPDAIAQGAAQPKMATTNVDPFVEMGKRSVDFASVDTTIDAPVDPTKVMKSPISVEEALLQSQWKPGQQAAMPQGKVLSAVDAQLQTLGQANQVKMDGDPSQMIDPTQAAEGIEPQMLHTKSAQPIVNQGIKVAMPTQSAPQITTPKLDTKLPVEELQLDVSQFDVPVEEMTSSDQRSFGGDGGEQSFGDRRGLESLGLGTLASAAKASRSEGVSFGSQLHADSSQLSTADRAQVVQQLMDRALTMVRQGGGAMKIDFSGMNMGQLEMAISVAGDRVDIKMMTDSHQIKDVLSGDIGQLREALASQNMTLGSVDVGVDSGDPEQEQMFTGHQNFQEDTDQQAKQLKRDFEDFVSGAVSRNADLAERAEIVKRMPIIPAMNQQGTLAVRV